MVTDFERQKKHHDPDGLSGVTGASLLMAGGFGDSEVVLCFGGVAALAVTWALALPLASYSSSSSSSSSEV